MTSLQIEMHLAWWDVWRWPWRVVAEVRKEFPEVFYSSSKKEFMANAATTMEWDRIWGPWDWNWNPAGPFPFMLWEKKEKSE